MYANLTSGTPALNDPLSQPSSWSAESNTSFGGTCQFSNGAYHISQSQPNSLSPCTSSAPNFSNFVFEAQMTIIKGDCGGMVFREDTASGKDYFFEACQDGSYNLFLYVDSTGTNNKSLTGNSSSAIHTGLNQTNLIAVVTNGSTLDLYVNNQKIDSVSDSTYSHGQIGLVAAAPGNPTEVVYSNAKVWML